MKVIKKPKHRLGMSLEKQPNFYELKSHHAGYLVQHEMVLDERGNVLRFKGHTYVK